MIFRFQISAAQKLKNYRELLIQFHLLLYIVVQKEVFMGMMLYKCVSGIYKEKDAREIMNID